MDKKYDELIYYVNYYALREAVKSAADKILTLPVEESVDWHCDVIPRREVLDLLYNIIAPLVPVTDDDLMWASAIIDAIGFNHTCQGKDT